jgi:hypothetical protein
MAVLIVILLLVLGLGFALGAAFTRTGGLGKGELKEELSRTRKVLAEVDDDLRLNSAPGMLDEVAQTMVDYARERINNYWKETKV